MKKYNKDFEDSVIHCRANPDLYQEEEEVVIEEDEDVKGNLKDGKFLTTVDDCLWDFSPNHVMFPHHI